MRNLPEFEKPPLNEVVLGVQFRHPNNFQPIHAFEVWQLFKERFPVTEEQMPLPPQFETFGLASAAGQFSLNLLDSALPNRHWFLTEAGEQLLQFQQDRLLHNWRKVGDGLNEYPRFEEIITSFADELRTLEAYFKGKQNDRLVITQAEVSYINHIELPSAGPVRAQDWLSVFSENASSFDELNLNARTVLRSSNGQPTSRFYRESGIGVTQKGRVLLLTLTVRGKPATDTIAGSLDFISSSRSAIVEEFARITTPMAHEIWKRTR